MLYIIIKILYYCVSDFQISILYFVIKFFRNCVLEKAKTLCNTRIPELFNVWEETGIKNEVLSTYSDQVLNHLDVST